MTRHYRQWRKREQFGRKLEQLHFELSVEAPRRVLDYLLDHLDDLLAQLDPSVLRDSLSGQLDRAKRLVAQRHNLRLVRSTKGTA